MACVDGQAPDDSGEMDDNQWMYTESGEMPHVWIWTREVVVMVDATKLEGGG